MRLYKRGKVYWIDAGKGGRFSTHLTDEAAAQKFVVDWRRDQERVSVGLAPLQGLKAPGVVDSIAAWTADLERTGRDGKYVSNAQRAVVRAAVGQNWKILAAVTVGSIQQHLTDLTDEGSHPHTVNAARAHISAWLGWCVRHGLIPSNPASQVSMSAVPKVRTRRALTEEECARLFALPARGWIYRTLVYTGLRRGEAGAILWKHVGEKAISLDAAITKSGQAETIPLYPAVAAMLAERRKGFGPGGPVLAVPDLKTFYKDLDAAQIQRVTDDGRVVLHSLRHTLCTLLMRAGVPVQHAQQIMRHRDIRLTLEVYTQHNLIGLPEAIAKLPDLSNGL